MPRYTDIMTPAESRILKDALKLPPEARAALAGSLLASLEEAPDPDAERAWSEEIHRRIRELESGEIRPIPWAEARRQIVGG